MRKLIIFLVVVILLAIAADRGAKYAAESAIAKQLASSYELDPAPSVDVHGIPFLTQAIGGTYDRIDVSMAEVSRDELNVKNVKAQLHGVRAPLSEVVGNGRNITAARAEGTALVPYATVKQRLPDGFTVKPDGSSLQVSGKARALGVSVPVNAKLKLKAGREGVIAKPSNIKVAGGRVPGSAVSNQIGFVVPIQDLPLHLKIQDVKVRPDGVQVSAEADQVKFTQS